MRLAYHNIYSYHGCDSMSDARCSQLSMYLSQTLPINLNNLEDQHLLREVVIFNILFYIDLREDIISSGKPLIFS